MGNEIELWILVRGLQPRHAALEALPPVWEQGLNLPIVPVTASTRHEEVQAAEPPRVRDAAEPRHEETIVVAGGGRQWRWLHSG